jgi:hypothetical protein
MSDIEVLDRFRADVPAVEPAVLRRARNRLLAETVPAGRVRVPGPGAPRWRLAAVGGGVLVVAAALFAIGNPMGVRVPTSTPDTEAAHLLQNAALAALNLPVEVPGPDRYVYVESVTAYANGEAHDGTIVWRLGGPKVRRIWLSVDGTNDGLLRERPQSDPGGWTETPLAGCRDGHLNPVPRQVGAGGPCRPMPAYRGDLPTGTDAMVRYLYRNSHGENPPDQQAFVTVGDLIREAYLPPAALSALYSAAARIPGVSVQRDVVDAAGRHGIAVARAFNGIRHELIFDPATYEFLGEREVVTRDGDGLTAGQLFGSAAVLRVAIVARPGQLP